MASSTIITQYHNALEAFVLDPKNHHVLSLVKSLRNGIVFGVKIRLPHALVMVSVFGSGTVREKLSRILTLTREHATYLALYSATYKLCRILIATVHPKPHALDPAWAGLVAGYLVFGRSYAPVSRQIILYILCQFLMALSARAVPMTTDGKRSPPDVVELVQSHAVLRAMLHRHGWPIFAALNWAAIMYMFEWHPMCISPSGRASMQYLFSKSDRWDSLWTLLVRS